VLIPTGLLAHALFMIPVRTRFHNESDVVHGEIDATSCAPSGRGKLFLCDPGVALRLPLATILRAFGALTRRPRSPSQFFIFFH
jgi:hypothetical protein